MAFTGVISVLLLLCAAYSRGFNIPAEPSVDGIYNGRFGQNNLKISAQAVFSQGGVSGSVVFSQLTPSDPVSVHVNLLGLDQYTDAYRWRIQEFPIRSSLLRPFPCSESEIGGLFNPDSINATAMCENTEQSMCALGDLSSKLGALRPDRPWQSFDDPFISLRGPNSIIGRSLVIDREDGPNGAFICSNIEQLGASRETLRAAFENDDVHGDVIIRFATGRDDATIEADLNIVNDSIPDGQAATWTINFGTPGPNNSCSGVGSVYGSASYIEDLYDCSASNQRECRLGDLTSKCGELEFGGDRARAFCTDNQIGSIPRTNLYDENHPADALMVVVSHPNFMACAPLQLFTPLTARANFQVGSIYGDFYFWQAGPDDRTYVRVHLTGLNGMDFSLRIYCNDLETSGCNTDTLGEVFSKQGGEFILPRTANSPLTSDAGLTGSLDVLIPLPPDQVSVRTTTSSSFLPLFGPFSIMGKTLALVREDTNRAVACSTITLQGEYPQGELSSLLGYQNLNNPPLPESEH